MDTRRVPVQLFIFLCVCSLSQHQALGIVTLRPKNERVAWESGVECLHQVQKLFHDLRAVLEDTEEGFIYPSSISTKNIILMHLYNLSSPAAEIERHYRKRIHDLISSGEMRR